MVIPIPAYFLRGQAAMGIPVFIEFSGYRIKSGMTAIKKIGFYSCLQFLSTQILSYTFHLVLIRVAGLIT